MNLSTNNREYQLSFSGHETFPLRQLWLKKVVSIADENDDILKKKFSDPEVIAKLGVGKNMLSSMRHWALSCEIIKEKSTSCNALSDFGKLIFKDDGLDPYSEHPTTTWLMHWKLATKGSKATTIYWVFNCINSPNFSKDELKIQLQNACKKAGKTVAEKSIVKDIDTNLRGYISKSGHASGEDIADPIFAELNLLNSEKTSHYSFNRGSKPSLNKAAFIFALLDFWKPTKDQSNTLSLDDIAYGDSSPGRIFKLDEDSIVEKLIDISDFTDNRIQWSNTAGVKQLSKTDFDFDGLMQDMLRRAYV
jgi:hypothetical protein